MKKLAHMLKPTFPAFREKELDVFWYPSLLTPPPDNYTPGMSAVTTKYIIAEVKL